MIQRIQSIWLFLAAVCALLTMQFSTYAGADSAGMLQLIKGTSNTFLVITTAMVAVVSMIALFLFKNRKLQIRIVFVAIALELILLFFYYRAIDELNWKGAISATALLHQLVIIFLSLAAKAISNDEKLIRDSNRLR
jgi:uncharacterized membrane protein YfhO